MVRVDVRLVCTVFLWLLVCVCVCVCVPAQKDSAMKCVQGYIQSYLVQFILDPQDQQRSKPDRGVDTGFPVSTIVAICRTPSMHCGQSGLKVMGGKGRESVHVYHDHMVIRCAMTVATS